MLSKKNKQTWVHISVTASIVISSDLDSILKIIIGAEYLLYGELDIHVTLSILKLVCATSNPLFFS